MKKSLLLATVIVMSAVSGAALAATDKKPAKQIDWAFDGPFGRVDKPSAQRGYQVYKEVCAACHSLSRVSFRNLEDIGFSKAEIKALAASYQVKDGPNDDGEMIERPGIAADPFPSPHANEQAARAAHNGAYPPDLSLITKARVDGPNYLYSLLTGYGEATPEDVHLGDGQHYNPYFSFHTGLAMPAPLSDGQITYQDGTTASLDQMSKDVVNFLQWAAEPEMEQRKRMGITVLLFLTAFTAFMYVAKRNLWSKLH